MPEPLARIAKGKKGIKKKSSSSGNVPESEDGKGGNGEGSRHWSFRERKRGEGGKENFVLVAALFDC